MGQVRPDEDQMQTCCRPDVDTAADCGLVDGLHLVCTWSSFGLHLVYASLQLAFIFIGVTNIMTIVVIVIVVLAVVLIFEIVIAILLISIIHDINLITCKWCRRHHHHHHRRHIHQHLRIYHHIQLIIIIT